MTALSLYFITILIIFKLLYYYFPVQSDLTELKICLGKAFEGILSLNRGFQCAWSPTKVLVYTPIKVYIQKFFLTYLF